MSTKPYLHGARWSVKQSSDQTSMTKESNERKLKIQEDQKYLGRIELSWIEGEKKYWEKKKNSRNISHTIIHVLTFEQQEQSNQSMQQHSYQITTSIHRNCCSGTPRNNQLCNINLHRGRNHPNKLSRIFHFTEPNSDYITQRSERSL